MDTLINLRFVQLLSSSKECDPDVLDSAYKDFIRAVVELCDNSDDYKYLFRTLTHTKVRIEMLRSAHRKTNLIKYISAADKIIESELKLLNERINHPSLFQQSPHIDIPELYWNSDFSKRDLVELLTSLEHLGPILNTVGKFVSFSVLVTFAEKTLHISLPNAYKIREEVLNRKTKSADFLKRLIDALIEKGTK